MRLYQKLAIVGTSLFELLAPSAYAAPPQVEPVQPEESVCLPLSEFERLCLPKPHTPVNPNPRTPQPHPTHPTRPTHPKRPKVPANSERCDKYFNDNRVGYTGVCVNDPATLQKNPDLITTPGPAGLCGSNTYCIGIMVKPQAPVEKRVEVRVEVPVPDKGAQEKIDELKKLVKERLPEVPAVPDLTGGPTLSVFGSEQGTIGFKVGYERQVSQRVRFGITGGYLHTIGSELRENATTSGQTHDLPNGIQEIVGNTHTAQSFRGADRGTIGIGANITLYDGPVLRIDASLGLEAELYKTGEGSKDQRDAYLMQNGQRTTDTKTATTQVPVDKHVTADMTGCVTIDSLFNVGKGVRVGPSLGVCVTFPNMSTEDVRVGGKYGVKATYEF